MFKLYRQHQGKIILISVLAAFVLGIVLPHIFAHLEFISGTFINLLKLCALPIVLTSLIVTIGNLQKLHELKKVARNSLIYIFITEIIAVTIGLIVFNSVDISGGINAESLLSGAKYTESTSTAIDPSHIFNYIFSSNIFHSLANFDVLPVVAFSIMFGITCALNQEKARPILDVMVSTREMFLSLLNGVMYLAPIAIFVLIGTSVADSYLSGALGANLIGLLKFVGLFFVGLFIHFLWQLLLVATLYRHLGIKRILSEAMPIFMTSFISSSSLATLPLALEKAVELGGKRKVVNFMLPICASMNFASGMMYEMAACLFFMHILGIHPDLSQQILLALACILTGIAVGGIPETSMVSFVTVFGMANIPLSAIAILMPLDRIVDRVRTMVNIFGNTCGTLIVSKTVD
ncbi:MAG: dicarboxylate/amino acid:cation symporter [Neisseriales bacterium]|jgi:Na+/H+-dicarboxylate symporter|nr:MAG: dicarboxylate/amino acid:cation symporter [Neisseriales bacterium]HRG64048.1 dicarboxylate/amino acid:cation symporter [Burkholderiales bacterium]